MHCQIELHLTGFNWSYRPHIEMSYDFWLKQVNWQKLEYPLTVLTIVNMSINTCLNQDKIISLACQGYFNAYW